jgi:hypothetical protein
MFNFLSCLGQVCRIPERPNPQRPTCAPYFHCRGEEVKIIPLPELIVLMMQTRHHMRFFQGPGPKYVPVQFFIIPVLLYM